MVTLFIGGQRADLGKDVAADLTYSLADIRTPDKRQVNFSKTLTLPGTSQNNFLFGYVADVLTENPFNSAVENIGLNFNPKKLVSAAMYSDGVQVFDGTLRLWKVGKKDGEIFYDVSLFGKLFDVFSAIGDAKLTDLDISDLNHAVTWANIQSNWSASAPAFRYPLVDYGALVLNVSGQPDVMKIGNIGPCLYHKVILDRIMSSVGASFTLNFSDPTIYNKLLVTPNRGEIVGHPRYFESHLNAVFLNYVAGGTDTTFTALPVTDTTDIGAVNLVVLGDYTKYIMPLNIATSLQFKIKFECKHNTTLTPSSGTARIEITKTTAGTPTTLAYYDIPLPPGGVYADAVIEIPKTNFLAADYLRVNITVPAGHRFTIYQGTTIKMVSPNDSFEYPLADGDIYEMNRSLPKDIKQVDFIKDFIRLFNLFVTQNPADPENLIFTPHPDFYDRDKTHAIEWTNKIDYDKEVQITPIGQLTAKEYRYTWKDDKDYWNDQYLTMNKETYAEFSYVSDTDVVTNKEEVKFIYSPAVMVRYQNSSVISPAIYKVDNAIKKSDVFGPRLLLWGGLKAAGHSIALKDYAGTTLYTVTNYPYAGHLDDPTAPTFDLNFGPTKTTLPTAPRTTFSEYWQAFLFQASDKDGKLIACTAYLKPEDIQALDFSALYKVGPQLYRLNKVDGFNPFALSTCKIELIKCVDM